MSGNAYGLTVTTQSPEAAKAVLAAVSDALEHRLSAAGHVKAALVADPECVMALALRAAMLLQIGSNHVHPKAAEALSQARVHAGGASKQERMHLVALDHWLAGNLGRACGVWEQILDLYPSDILALRYHHHGSFWTGDREGLRRAPQKMLGLIGEDTPMSGAVMGMAAFGLEECGEYAEAERYGREAVARNEHDLWALHAVAHVLEMQCRHGEGRALLDRPHGTWSDRNPFKDHLWWHGALFALEQGDTEAVLALYDREVRVDETGFYLDVQNAASLLKRLELVGVDVGARWEELADLAQSRTGDHVMPFTDAHFMLALTGAGRMEAARSYLASLEEFARTGSNEAARVTGELAVPLCAGLLALAQGRADEAADILCALRGGLSPIGASHAQRDIFEQVTIEAVSRAGRAQEARALLAEREAGRPGNAWTQERLAALAA